MGKLRGSSVQTLNPQMPCYDILEAFDNFISCRGLSVALVRDQSYSRESSDMQSYFNHISSKPDLIRVKGSGHR